MAFSRRSFIQGSVTLGGAATLSGYATEGHAKKAPAVYADPVFNVPYVDVDEWRDAPVRHRYVHGGFTGTGARFSFYFPPKEQYDGRFFQLVTPTPYDEKFGQQFEGEGSYIGFAISSGGYFVLTNQGGYNAAASPGSYIDPAIAAYRVNAAGAEFSRKLAAEMYGGQRPYGYCFGGSGGAYRTLGCVENTTVWDGSVPFVMGTPNAIPAMFTCRIHALRLLKGKFPQILDAIEPGGSSDMYAGLNEEERAALQEATGMGFPPRTWFLHESLGAGPFAYLFDLIRQIDPGYFEDFWKVPGYLGANPPPSLANARIQHPTTVVRVIMSNEAAEAGLPVPHGVGLDRDQEAAKAWREFEIKMGGGKPFPVAFQLKSPPKGDLEGASIFIKSGAGTGGSVSVGQLVGDKIIFWFSAGIGSMRDITGPVRAGDKVQVDNSDFLAVQTYHRHNVPSKDYYVWDMFRNKDGNPIYPQRPRLLGPLFARAAAGSIESGKFHGKMIVVETLMDEDALPWQADWYRNKAKEHLGARLDDNYRLYYIDHALHVSSLQQKDPTRTVTYRGALYQALRDLSAWVEKGTKPPTGTSYTVEDGQVMVPPKAGNRKGIQPVIEVAANGNARAEVAVGEAVDFSSQIDVPPGTGSVVSVDWDFEGKGDFPVSETLTDTSKTQVTVTRTYTFLKPGTYFPALLAISQRSGDPDTPYGRVRNLGRVRVVVS